MHLFYAPNITSDQYTLTEEESKHAVRVLRIAVGDQIILVDGIGLWCEAEIVDAHPKKCTVAITKKTELTSSRNFKLIMAVAPTKNSSRIEWFLEKATEIGVDEVIPLITDHGERLKIKPERWEKVLISAMKQSLKAHLPTLSEPLKIKSIFDKYSNANHLIAHCREGDKTHLIKVNPTQPTVIIYIGPEGDFSVKEIDFALQNSFTPISLGEERLRTETAALTACHIANLWKYV